MKKENSKELALEKQYLRKAAIELALKLHVGTETHLRAKSVVSEATQILKFIKGVK